AVGQCVGDDRGSDVVDVLAAVAVLRRVLEAGTGKQGAGEPVDLGAVVVEVVLAGDVGAGGLEHPGQGVPDGRPPHPADVDRAGRVGRDELEVDPGAATGLAAAVGGPRGDDGAGQLPGGARLEADVEEPGAGDVRGGDAGLGAQPLGEQFGQRPGRRAGLLGQLHGDVGGPVAVLPLPGSLDQLGRA